MGQKAHWDLCIVYNLQYSFSYPIQIRIAFCPEKGIVLSTFSELRFDHVCRDTSQLVPLRIAGRPRPIPRTSTSIGTQACSGPQGRRTSVPPSPPHPNQLRANLHHPILRMVSKPSVTKSVMLKRPTHLWD
jgi:hypothetical protein